MFRAVPRSWFSADYVMEHDGQSLGELKLSQSTTARLLNGAPVVVLQLEGMDYELSAEVASTALPFLRKLKRVVLQQAGNEIAWAEPSRFGHFFTVHWDGRKVDLNGGFWNWARKIHIVEGGKEAGTINRGYFSKTTDFDLPGGVPLRVQIFILWLALWRLERPPDSGG